MIHVVCFRPGMHRGGRRNPRHAAYAPGDHTPDELRELVNDPEIIVIDGGAVLTDAAIDAQVAANALAAAKTEETPTKKQKV